MYTKMPLNMPPIPAPGFEVYPDFTAKEQQIFVIKYKYFHHDYMYTATPSGKTIAPILKIGELHRGSFWVKTLDGKPLIRVKREHRTWKTWKTWKTRHVLTFHGMNLDQTETAWTARLNGKNGRKSCGMLNLVRATISVFMKSRS
jgi:hypothetical protein